MGKSRIVIAGGGMVAGYAAKKLIELGMGPGELTILSADTSAPYERPPLSKTFLAGKDTEESIRINDEGFYRDHGVELRLGCQVTGIDTKQKKVLVRPGGAVEFESLVIATGSQVRTLNVPGSQLAGIHYLRSVADSKAIRERATAAKRAAVIGGGFIGMEVASVLAQKQVQTTMILPEDRIWKRLFTGEMSQTFEKYFADRGVRFVKGAKVTAFRGDGAVEAVELGGGSNVKCDMVVAGIGVRPVTEWLAGSGIEIEDGVKVDEYLETNVRGIFAAGDLANYPDVLFGKRRRVEHWDNAVSQGEHCARVLMGERTPFRHVPYFFSDVFDFSYEFWGDPAEAEHAAFRGDLAGGSFSVWWLARSAVVAAFVMKRPDEERETAPKWIESRQRVSAERLAEESSPIAAAAVADRRAGG
jgi:NADPH-dependent 2,4-dienoyl-CoA reductase/sulfur reductase-like enzyme